MENKLMFKGASKIFFLGVLLLLFSMTLVSAADWDNIDKKVNLNKLDQVTIGDKQIDYKNLWEKYPPIKIDNLFGLGGVLWSGAITEHTSYCTNYCYSIIEVYLPKKGVLIEDIKFKFKQEDGSWLEQDIQDYQLSVDGVPYEIGTEMEAGNYQVTLTGEKKSSETIDWVIKTNGIWLDDWAIWQTGFQIVGVPILYDNFNDNNFNSSLWTNVTTRGGGAGVATMHEQNNKLEMTANNPGGTNENNVYLTTKENYTSYLEWDVDKLSTNYAANTQSVSIGGTIIVEKGEGPGADDYSTGNWKLRLNTTGVHSLYKNDVFVRNITADLSNNFVEFRSRANDGTYAVEQDIDNIYLNEETIGLAKNAPANETVTLNNYMFLNATVTPQISLLNPQNVVINNMTFRTYHDNGTLFNETTLDISDTIETTKTLNLSNLIIDTYLWDISVWVTLNNGTTISVRDITEGNRTFFISTFLENSFTANASSSETSTQEFYTNLTTNGTAPTSASLWFGGARYTSATITSLGAEDYNLTKSIDIPAAIGAKDWFFNFNLGGFMHNTSTQSQLVNLTNLTICTTGFPYINFTFKDEETTTLINATIDTSTWEYYLGSGDVTKTMLFSNNSVNYYYPFCLDGSNETLHNTRSVQFASPGYPQRKYDASSDLTNTTTNKILWLLSSADGIYTTIQIVDNQGNRISGVGVTAERQFAGLWTIIGQETTDDAGSVTFWVNPDYDHKFTFVSDDCIGDTVTIRPTQTQYTQQLACDGTGESFVSNLEGIKYARTPMSGIIQTGEYNFTYQVVSAKDNIVNVSFQLINSSNSAILNSTYDSCAPSGCIISFFYTVVSGADFKGEYYLDLGNGTFLLEGDARWINVPIDTAGKAGLGTFMQDLIYIFQEWGDDSNTADFNRLVTIFFFLCIFISFLNYNFNMDTLNPGAFMVILTVIIFMGSIVGGTDSQGLFYFNNLSTSTFINNYLLLFVTGIISLSYFINIQRQAQK